MQGVIIVESPGTARRLQSVLSSQREFIAENLLLEKIDVIACKGYVLSYEKNFQPLGIYFDKEKESIYEERKIKNPSLFFQIKNIVSQSDILYIATDQDEEGETIAKDLHDLLKNVLPDQVERVSFPALDKKSILESLKKENRTIIPSNYSWQESLSGESRRIYDRWISGVLGTTEKPVGRVISNYLDAAKKTRKTMWKEFGLPPKENFDGPNLGDILMAPELLDFSVSEIQESLQSLYESGQISYPRTESRCFQKINKYSHTAIKIVSPKVRDEISDIYKMEPTDLPKEMRILCAIERRKNKEEWENGILFGWKRITKGDPKKIKDNLSERQVLSVLLKNNLGRPSSWANFSKKSKDFVFPNGEMTEWGFFFSSWQPKDLDLDYNKKYRKIIENAKYQERKENVKDFLESLPISQKKLLEGLREKENLSPILSF